MTEIAPDAQLPAAPFEMKLVESCVRNLKTATLAQRNSKHRPKKSAQDSPMGDNQNRFVSMPPTQFVQAGTCQSSSMPEAFTSRESEVGTGMEKLLVEF